jgi:hypothetical protein
MNRSFRNIGATFFSVAFLALLAFAAYWHVAPPQSTCLSCHEIQPAHDRWANSSHRGIGCEGCHGTAISNGFHSLWENARRVVTHFSQDDHDNIRLSEEQVVEMVGRCRTCHEREHAAWLGSGHSMTYRDVFLNEKQNSNEQINEDCLRCHGMFYEGRIHNLVEPISIEGPWRMVDEKAADRPSIPCLACHRIHAPGSPTTQPDYSQPQLIAHQRAVRVTPLHFYQRHEKLHLEAALLSQPGITLNGVPVKMSPDRRQALCYQCHSPNAMHEAGSSDDRTPRGVHEGISCLACHASHSMDTRHSCAQCHPQLSNCGLDVETMFTTYLSPESPYNIHFVACVDCHTAGVPAKKQPSPAPSSTSGD